MLGEGGRYVKTGERSRIKQRNEKEKYTAEENGKKGESKYKSSAARIREAGLWGRRGRAIAKDPKKR